MYSRHAFATPVETCLAIGSSLEPQMRAIVRLGQTDVALYNIHLLPPRRWDYFVEHRNQLADLADLLKQERLPSIIAGDFNFTANSTHARILRESSLSDAYDAAGHGRGTTWPVNGLLRWLPGLRLDHIYFGKDLACVRCRTGEGRGSDHRPVIATLAMDSESLPTANRAISHSDCQTHLSDYNSPNNPNQFEQQKVHDEATDMNKNGIALYQRHYVKTDADMADWAQIEPYFDELERRPIDTKEQLEQWLVDQGELGSCLDQEQTTRRVAMTLSHRRPGNRGGIPVLC